MVQGDAGGGQGQVGQDLTYLVGDFNLHPKSKGKPSED